MGLLTNKYRRAFSPLQMHACFLAERLRATDRARLHLKTIFPFGKPTAMGIGMHRASQNSRDPLPESSRQVVKAPQSIGVSFLAGRAPSIMRWTDCGW